MLQLIIPRSRKESNELAILLATFLFALNLKMPSPRVCGTRAVPP